MEHEPTLSIRYIFHIIPSTQMAEILKEALVNDSKDLTFEDNKNVTVGFMNDDSKMTLRLDFVDPTMYYFYPVTNPKSMYIILPVQQKHRQMKLSLNVRLRMQTFLLISRRLPR